jgi:hypothetical protein
VLRTSGRSAAVLLLLSVSSSLAFAEEASAADAEAEAPGDKPIGVVIGIGDAIDLDACLGAARQSGGALWRAERILPAATQAPKPPEAEVAKLSRFYVGADFMRCLALLQSESIDFDRLLEAGHRKLAAQVAVLGSACAHGAGDVETSRALLRRALIAELDVAESLRRTTPEFQKMEEMMVREVVAGPSVDATFVTEPSGARLEIDGRMLCESTPCVGSARVGVHVIRAAHFGYLERSVSSPIKDQGPLTIALDPAPAEIVRAQLDGYLGSGLPIDKEEVVFEAARGFGARVVTEVWKHDGEVGALVYDRGLKRIVARSTVHGATDGEALVVRNVVEEWRGIVEPTPLLASPLFWIITVSAAAAAAGVAYLVTRPDERRFGLAVSH